MAKESKETKFQKKIIKFACGGYLVKMKTNANCEACTNGHTVQKEKNPELYMDAVLTMCICATSISTYGILAADNKKTGLHLPAIAGATVARLVLIYEKRDKPSYPGSKGKAYPASKGIAYPASKRIHQALFFTISFRFLFDFFS